MKARRLLDPNQSLPTPEVNTILALCAYYDLFQSDRVASLFAKKAIEQWPHADREFRRLSKACHKLVIMVVDSFLAELDVAGARAWLDNREEEDVAGQGILLDCLRKRVDAVAGVLEAHPDKRLLQRLLITCLPRCKPTLCVAPVVLFLFFLFFFFPLFVSLNKSRRY